MFNDDKNNQIPWWHGPLDIVFRVGAIVLPVPIALILREHWRVAWQEARNGPDNAEFYPYIAWFVLTLLGIVLAIRGINYSAESRSLRVAGIIKIAFGVGIFFVAIICTVVTSNYLEWAGIAIVFTGVAFVGIGTTIVGLLQMITGNEILNNATISAINDNEN